MHSFLVVLFPQQEQILVAAYLKAQPTDLFNYTFEELLKTVYTEENWTSELSETHRYHRKTQVTRKENGNTQELCECGRMETC